MRLPLFLCLLLLQPLPIAAQETNPLPPETDVQVPKPKPKPNGLEPTIPSGDEHFDQLFDDWEALDADNWKSSQVEESREPKEILPDRFRAAEQFGDWFVVKVTDKLDPYVTYQIATVSRRIGSDVYGPYVGFQIVDGRGPFLVFSDAGGTLRRPCDLDDASFSVDGGKARFLALVRRQCRLVAQNGSAIRQFRTGREAVIRPNARGAQYDIRVSLAGFSAALDFALANGKR